MLKIGIRTKYATWMFLPQDDITALELAEIIALMFNAQKASKDQQTEWFNGLSDGAKRHFKVQEAERE